MVGSDQQFRILSLDGGGVRGALSAQLLLNIENYLNAKEGKVVPIGRRFDLLVGTSTGGLIALALACGKSAAEVAAFYDEQIPKIFGSVRRGWIPGWLERPKYGVDNLRAGLEAFLGELTLRELQSDLCVTSVALQNAKPRFYKTDYLKRNEGRLGERLVDIALATTAAPTYFPAHSSKLSTDLVDGGLCANNPAVVGIVEALQFERQSKRQDARNDVRSIENLVMVSIGTGEPCAMPYDHRKLRGAGLRRWVLSFGSSGATVPLFDVTTESQSVLAHFQAAFMLGDRYLRVNPKLTFPMRLDDVSMLPELKNLADLEKAAETFLTTHF
jgi:patatin-like phospholipase/acyl hydrolase